MEIELASSPHQLGKFWYDRSEKMKMVAKPAAHNLLIQYWGSLICLYKCRMLSQNIKEALKEMWTLFFLMKVFGRKTFFFHKNQMWVARCYLFVPLWCENSFDDSFLVFLSSVYSCPLVREYLSSNIFNWFEFEWCDYFLFLALWVIVSQHNLEP